MKRLICCLALAGLLAGCSAKAAGTGSASASSASAASTFAVGHSVVIDETAGQSTVTLNAIYLNKTTEHLKAENGQYVVADVTIRCSSGSCSYSPFDFTVTTPDLRSWTSSLPVFDPRLNDGALDAGQATRGNITFDVEPGQISGVNLSGAQGKILATWAP